MAIKQEINYFIDREKEVCVAKVMNLPAEIDLFMGRFFSNGREAPSSVLKWYSKVYKRLPMAIEAKATCSPYDDFDVDKGMELARLRLEGKVARWEMKVLREYAADMEAEINAANNVLDSLVRAVDKTADKIVDVVKD